MPEFLGTRKAPYAVEVQERKNDYWCACGRSNNQPFCAGPAREQVLSRWDLLQKGLKRFIYVAVKRQGINPSVAVPITNCKSEKLFHVFKFLGIWINPVYAESVEATVLYANEN